MIWVICLIGRYFSFKFHNKCADGVDDKDYADPERGFIDLGDVTFGLNDLDFSDDGNGVNLNLINSISKELVLVFILDILYIDGIARTVGQMVLIDIDAVILDVAQIEGISRYSLDHLNLAGGPTTRQNENVNQFFHISTGF